MSHRLILFILVLSASLANAQTAVDNLVSEAKKYIGEGRLDMAVTAYTQALQLDSTKATTWAGRAYVYHKMDSLDKAIGDYTQCLLRDTANEQAYMQRGNILIQKELYNHAVNDFSHAIKLNAKNSNAYYMRAACYMALGQPTEAIKDYDKCKPTNVVYYMRGKAKEQLALTTEALADYTLAIGLDEKYDLARLSRGMLYITLRKYTEAVGDLTVYINQHPKEGKAYFYRAQAYEALGSKALACKDYDKAISTGFLNPKEKPQNLCQ